MPFGLCNAPGTFQRLMDDVAPRSISWLCCLVYLDDIIVHTRGSFALHMVHLAEVFERLEGAGLSFKAAKCCFGQTLVEYLEHAVTCEGIRPTERLVTAVRDFPGPGNPICFISKSATATERACGISELECGALV